MANVIIWDTKVKETISIGDLTQTNSWKNKANWYQIPYGTTSYTFVGETLIENDNYFLFLKTLDSPFLYANINGVPSYNQIALQTVAELGGSNRIWNWWKGFDTIIENTQNEVIVRETAAISSNTVDFTVKSNSNFLKISPANNYKYTMLIHSAPNRYALSPPNTGTGTDFVIDARIDATTTGSGRQFYLPSDKNIYVLQEIYQSPSAWMVMITTPTPSISNAYIDTILSPGPRLEQVDYQNIQVGTSNNAAYIGVINYLTFHEEDLNQAISTGQKYTSSWHPTIPGRWRMNTRINVGGTRTYYTQDVYDGNFVFTSPNNGTLEVVSMYIYDRITSTPSNIQTPQDIYKSIFGTQPCPTPICDYTITVI